MYQGSPTLVPDTSRHEDVNWFEAVRSTFDEAGFSVEGLPTSMTQDEANAALWGLIAHLRERGAEARR